MDQGSYRSCDADGADYRPSGASAIVRDLQRRIAAVKQATSPRHTSLHLRPSRAGTVQGCHAEGEAPRVESLL